MVAANCKYELALYETFVELQRTYAMAAQIAGLASAILKHDIGVIFQMWKDKGQDVPWALWFGVPPAAIMLGGMPIPKWTDEAGFTGALIGNPVEVVKCEMNDIRVPASAENVFEGTVSISETAPEGPMMEYHGHVWPDQPQQCPLFKVNAITYREDPILPICITGRATEENHTVWDCDGCRRGPDICQAAGLPIQNVCFLFEPHDIWYVIQIDREKLRASNTNMTEFCTRLGHVVFGLKPGWYMGKVFLVGEDVDPTSLRDVIWTESTRCEPGTSEFLFDEYVNIPLIHHVGHGVKPEGNHKKVVKCCMLLLSRQRWSASGRSMDLPVMLLDRLSCRSQTQVKISIKSV